MGIRIAEKMRRMRLIRSFGSSERGAIALNFALMIVPIIAMTGLAIDGSRAFLVKYRFQAALDAAALAVGATYGDDGTLLSRVEDYVGQNFDIGGTTVRSVAVQSSADDVVVRGSVGIETYFINIVWRGDLEVTEETQVKRAGGGLMVSLVLDNTGSMWTSGRIESLRRATELLVDEVFMDETEPEHLYLGIVPYASMVNVGDEVKNGTIINPGWWNEDLLRWVGPLGSDGLPTVTKFRVEDPHAATGYSGWQLPVLNYDPADKTHWKGCVRERPASGGVDHSIADTSPTEGGYWDPLIWPVDGDNPYRTETYWDYGMEIGRVKADTVVTQPGHSTNKQYGPNVGCPTPITPLTNSRTTVDNAVDAMTAWNRGGTLADIGMSWGIRVLSPGAPFTESATHVDPDTGEAIWESNRWRRAIVLMTDGNNTLYDAGTEGGLFVDDEASDMTGYGRVGEGQMNALFATANSGTIQTKVNERMLALCEQAKAQHITVYTIVFSDSVSGSTKSYYRQCATDLGKYWVAPSGEALEGAFGAIGSDLNKLRIIR